MTTYKSGSWAGSSLRRNTQRAKLLADGRLARSMSHRPIADILLLTGLSRARLYRAMALAREADAGQQSIDPLLL